MIGLEVGVLTNRLRQDTDTTEKETDQLMPRRKARKGLRGISEAEYCLVEREDGPKRWMLGYVWNELGKSMRSGRIQRKVCQ